MRRIAVWAAGVAVLVAGLALGAVSAGRASTTATTSPAATTTTAPSTSTTTPSTSTTTPSTSTTTPATTTPPHGRYDGIVGRGRVSVIVASSGKQVSALSVNITAGRCTGGKSYTVSKLIHPRTHPATIVRGTATVKATLRAPGPPGQPQLSGTQTINAVLHVTATAVSGTISSTLTGQGVHCSTGRVAYTAYRDGTPQAPLKSATIETGTYSAGRTAVTVFLPGQLVIGVSVPVTFHCSNKTSVAQTVKLGDVDLTGNAFSYSFSGPFNNPKKHQFGHYTASLTGQFSHPAGGYVVSLKYSGARIYSVHGSQVSCTASYTGSAYGP